MLLGEQLDQIEHEHKAWDLLARTLVERHGASPPEIYLARPDGPYLRVWRPTLDASEHVLAELPDPLASVIERAPGRVVLTGIEDSPSVRLASELALRAYANAREQRLRSALARLSLSLVARLGHDQENDIHALSELARLALEQNGSELLRREAPAVIKETAERTRERFKAWAEPLDQGGRPGAAGLVSLAALGAEHAPPTALVNLPESIARLLVLVASQQAKALGRPLLVVPHPDGWLLATTPAAQKTRLLLSSGSRNPELILCDLLCHLYGGRSWHTSEEFGLTLPAG